MPAADLVICFRRYDSSEVKRCRDFCDAGISSRSKARWKRVDLVELAATSSNLYTQPHQSTCFTLLSTSHNSLVPVTTLAHLGLDRTNDLIMSSEPMAVEAPSLTSETADRAHVPHPPTNNGNGDITNGNGTRKRPGSPGDSREVSPTRPYR